MKYKALVSFSGLISMSMGEVREIEDPEIAKDLLKVGYIHPVEPELRSAGVKDKSKLADSQSAARPLGQKGGRRKKNED